MNMSSESLLVILFVGLVAGWLADQIVQEAGSDSSANASFEAADGGGVAGSARTAPVWGH
jgi:hypothetical protein